MRKFEEFVLSRAPALLELNVSDDLRKIILNIQRKHLTFPEEYAIIYIQREDGGEGSGNHDHEGRPGERGGSLPKASSLNENISKAYKSGNISKVKEALRDGMARAGIGTKLTIQTGNGTLALEKTDKNRFEYTDSDGTVRSADTNYIINRAVLSGKSSAPVFEDHDETHGLVSGHGWKQAGDFIEDGGATEECTGFASKRQQHRHFNKHGDEFEDEGVADEKSYTKRAKEFLAQECGGNIAGFTCTYKGKNGNASAKIYRYNTETTEIACGIPGGKIFTYMKAGYKRKTRKVDREAGLRYYNRKKEEERAGTYSPFSETGNTDAKGRYRMDEEGVLCPVCGKARLLNILEECPVCEWVHDPDQEEEPNLKWFGNRMSLDEAKAAWAKGEEIL